MEAIGIGKLLSDKRRDSEETYHGNDVGDALLESEEGESRLPEKTRFQCPSCSRWMKPSSSGGMHKFLPILRAFVILFSLWGIIDISMKATTLHRQFAVRQWHSLTGDDPTCYCGNSTTEAIALGCKYDSMAQGWLPDHCRDDELLEEFEKSGPNEGGGWSFFRDENHTIPMTYEEVAMLANTGEKWYTEWDWHAAHCMYYWKKQWRSWHGEGHELYETTTGAYDHIAHCENAIRWTSKGTKGWVNLGGNH